MFISLEELEFHRVVVSETYASGALDYHGAAFKQLGPIKVSAAAELTGQEIHIQGRIGGRLRAECDRCLAKVEMSLERDFDLYYRPLKTIAREEEVEVPANELNVGFFSDSGIALEDVVTEQVILSVPMNQKWPVGRRAGTALAGPPREWAGWVGQVSEIKLNGKPAADGEAPR